VRILGLVFAGSATDNRAEMSEFVGTVLGLPRITDAGVDADLFGLPDGARFAVSSALGMGPTARAVGFLVDDLDAARAELEAAGARPDEPSETALHRYLHFTAPDGHLYELVEPAAKPPPPFPPGGRDDEAR